MSVKKIGRRKIMRADYYKRWTKLTMGEKREIVDDWHSGCSKITVRLGKERPEKFQCADGKKRSIDDIAPIDIDVTKDGKLVITPAPSGPLEWYRKHKKKWAKQVKDETIVLDDILLAFWDDNFSKKDRR